MSHKSICATILALGMFGLSSPSSATRNAAVSQDLRDPLNFSETDTPEGSGDLTSPVEVGETIQLPESIEQVPADVTNAPAGTGPVDLDVMPAQAQLPKQAQMIKTLLSDDGSYQSAGFTNGQVSALAKAYDLRKFEPVWFANTSLKALAYQLIDELRQAEKHGLDPQAYGVRQLASVIDVLEASNGSAQLRDIALVELQLTRAFAIYSAHMAGGVVAPSKILKNVYITPYVPTLEEMLSQLEETHSVERLIADLKPEAPSYEVLQQQLVLYNKAINSNYPVYIEDGPSIRPGDTGIRVAQLMKRLKAEGYTSRYSGYTGTSETEATPSVYDEDMVEAVKAFQQLNGLMVDGIIGKQTRAALNMSLQDRRDQILVNLERMRWDDPLPDGRYVKVNIAEQMVRIMEGTNVLYETRSVVGKPLNATPLFSDKFSYAEINPTWGVPWSIATNEYLPKLKRNSSALSGSGIRVYKNGKRVDPTAVNWSSVSKRGFGYQLRQKAGRKNALGAVKYMFPNKYNIYLHDTPSKRLFNKDQRAFSHGCIRLQDPFTFGEVLLAPSGHSRTKMERLRARGKTVRLNLSEKVPVHLRYYTAFADENGALQFREDIYKQDKAILSALQEKQEDSKTKMASMR